MDPIRRKWVDLLGCQSTKGQLGEYIKEYNLGIFRHVAVYDMREFDKSPNKALQRTGR